MIGIPALLAAVHLVFHVAVFAQSSPESSYISNNVVIVLDASGSMNQTMRGATVKRMDAAKSALRELVQRIPPDTNVGLLVFSSANLRNEWAYPLGPRDEAKLLAAIDAPQPGGGTPLGAYIAKGTNALLERRKKQFGYGTYRLLVVTDGQAGDPEIMERNTPQALARGILLDVVGVDMQADHTLAKSAYSYRRANDPESLTKALAEVFAEIGGAVGDESAADAFDTIAPLPHEIAQAVIASLAKERNEPISLAAAQTPPPQPARNQTSSAASTANSANRPKGRGLSFAPLAFMFFIFAIIAFSSVARRKRGR
jgi:uncharacterized protein (DUF58 family)